MSADGKKLNPRTSTTIYLFVSSRFPQSVFSRNHVTVWLHQNLPQSKDVENTPGKSVYIIADTIVADIIYWLTNLCLDIAGDIIASLFILFDVVS